MLLMWHLDFTRKYSDHSPCQVRLADHSSCQVRLADHSSCQERLADMSCFMDRLSSDWSTTMCCVARRPSPHTQMVPRLTNGSEHLRLLGPAHSSKIQTMLSSIKFSHFYSRTKNRFLCPLVGHAIFKMTNSHVYCATMWHNHLTCTSFNKQSVLHVIQ